MNCLSCDDLFVFAVAVKYIIKEGEEAFPRMTACTAATQKTPGSFLAGFRGLMRVIRKAWNLWF